jgi:hypothetical protein
MWTPATRSGCRSARSGAGSLCHDEMIDALGHRARGSFTSLRHPRLETTLDQPSRHVFNECSYGPINAPSGHCQNLRFLRVIRSLSLGSALPHCVNITSFLPSSCACHLSLETRLSLSRRPCPVFEGCCVETWGPSLDRRLGVFCVSKALLKNTPIRRYRGKYRVSIGSRPVSFLLQADV